MSHPSERAANIRDHHLGVIADLRRDIELHEIVVFVQDCIMEGVDATTVAEELQDVEFGEEEGDASVAALSQAATLDDLFAHDYPHAADEDKKTASMPPLYAKD